MAHNILTEILTFTKAESSAVMATAFDYIVLFICDKLLGWDFYLSTFIGAVCGGTMNCFINYNFVFYSSDLKKAQVVSRYFIIWSGSIILNFLGTLFFKGVVHMKAYYARVVTTVLVGICWNYGMQRCFVFYSKGKSTV